MNKRPGAPPAGDRRRRRRRRRPRSHSEDSRHGTHAAEAGRAPSEPFETQGVLQMSPDGSGYLRSLDRNYIPSSDDIFVPRRLSQETGLAPGAEVVGTARREGRRRVLQSVDTICGVAPEKFRERHPFSELTSIDPQERFDLDVPPGDISMRILELLTPIGKGQRCLIVSPPRAGKTMLLQKIGIGLNKNHPDVHLIVLLIDERPEEVTDMRRTVQGEIVASSLDDLTRHHVAVAEIVGDRAKRLVELGQDVVVLLDSITRLSRAYNASSRSGKTMSGGLDSRTMEAPRAFFGAARKAEEGGSLTIVGTCLVDTGSRMDEIIFQEFKGTGNTELVLDRKLAEQRIYPAINIPQSGTRKEEKLFSDEELHGVHLLRRALASREGPDTMRLLVERVSRFQSNLDFLRSLKAV